MQIPSNLSDPSTCWVKSYASKTPTTRAELLVLCRRLRSSPRLLLSSVVGPHLHNPRAASGANWRGPEISEILKSSEFSSVVFDCILSRIRNDSRYSGFWMIRISVWRSTAVEMNQSDRLKAVSALASLADSVALSNFDIDFFHVVFVLWYTKALKKW